MLLLFLSLFQIATPVFGVQCISAGKNKLLANQLNYENIKDNSFLDAYQKSKAQLACNCSNGEIVNMTKNLKEAVEPQIKKECIEKSMSNISSMNTQRRLLCDSNYGLPKFGSVVYGKKDLCVSKEVVDYVHWSVNESLKCINSITEYPLSPDITFMKLHRESKFGFFIQYPGGIGIGQLTSIAVKEVEQNGNGIIQKALKSPACENFQELLNKKMDYTKKGHVRHCQLTGIGEGIGRNLFYSFALMLHHRDSGNNSVGSRLRRKGFNDSQKINYFTLVSYGREGLAGAEDAMEKMAYKLAVKKNKQLSNNYKNAIREGIKMIESLPMSEFIEMLRNESEYVNENFESLEDFYQVHASVPKSKISDAITKRSLCVSPSY